MFVEQAIDQATGADQKREAVNRALAGTIIGTPATLESPLYAQIPSHGPNARRGPCTWQPIAGAGGKLYYPAGGEYCMVQYDEEGRNWITSWIPTPESHFTNLIANLENEVNALKSGTWVNIESYLGPGWSQVGGETPYVKKQGDNVRMIGRIGYTGASEFPSGSGILRLPPFFRPVHGGLLPFFGYPPSLNSSLFVIMENGGEAHGWFVAATNIPSTAQIFLAAYPPFPLT